MRSVARAVPLLLLALTLLAGTADATVRRVLVFPLTGAVPGDKGDALDRLTQVVARSAGLTGAEVVIGQATFDDTAALAGCASADAACLTQVAGALQVDHVVLGTVTPSADATTVEVSLTAFVNGAITQRTFTLTASSVDAMVEELAREAPKLFVGEKAPELEPDKKPDKEPDKKPRAELIPEPVQPRDDGFRAGRVGMLSWGLAGGGILIAGTGVAMFFLAADRQDQVDNAPINTVEDFERLRALEDEGRRFALLGDGLVTAGGVALLVGGVLIIYQGLAGDDAPAPRRVSLVPVPLRGGAGLSLEVMLP